MWDIRMEKKENRKRIGVIAKILLTILIVTAALAAVFGIYVSQYYHAGEAAKSYLEDNANKPFTYTDKTVKVTQEGHDWLFDGPGKDTAIIFYPGAKVDTKAYAPVMYLTAQLGYDCFLVDMPFHLAFFGMNRAENVMEKHPDYTHWYMAGHSLGGAMAGNYAAEHLDQFDGVIFLAAYPTKSLETNGFKVLSIFGSNDGVLNRKHYKNSMSLMPKDFKEVVIDGGNHGQFGDYGEQKGDGKASIGNTEQWSQTAEAIYKWMRS